LPILGTVGAKVIKPCTQFQTDGFFLVQRTSFPPKDRRIKGRGEGSKRGMTIGGKVQSSVSKTTIQPLSKTTIFYRVPWGVGKCPLNNREKGVEMHGRSKMGGEARLCQLHAFILSPFPGQCLSKGFRLKFGYLTRLELDPDTASRVFDFAPFGPGGASHGKQFPCFTVKHERAVFIFHEFKGHDLPLGERPIGTHSRFSP
jgi:hypothetical protein